MSFGGKSSPRPAGELKHSPKPLAMAGEEGNKEEKKKVQWKGKSLRGGREEGGGKAKLRVYRSLQVGAS